MDLHAYPWYIRASSKVGKVMYRVADRDKILRGSIQLVVPFVLVQ